MTCDAKNPQPVQDWENKEVKGMALCWDGAFESHFNRVKKLRERQSAYEESLPTNADEAFREIKAAILYSEDIGEKEYGLRAALRVYNIIFTKAEPLEDGDIDALYWLNCQAEDALNSIEKGNKRARDIASKYLDTSQEQVDRVGKAMDAMEPEVSEGLMAMLEAVVSHRIPIEEAMAVFNKVVDEHRSKTAA